MKHVSFSLSKEIKTGFFFKEIDQIKLRFNEKKAYFYALSLSLSSEKNLLGQKESKYETSFTYRKTNKKQFDADTML